MSANDRPIKNVILYDENGNTIYFTSGSICTSLVGNSCAMYGAATAAFSPGATPTDIFTIQGSSNSIVRITRLILSTTQSTAGTNTWFLLLRSSINNGGTAALLTAVPYDNISQPANAVVKNYTSKPSSLGNIVGNIQTFKLFSPATSSVAVGGMYTYDFTCEGQSRGVVLRDNSSLFAINFNGASLPSGFSVNIAIEWIEE